MKLVLLALVLVAETAAADILVMRGPDGQLHLTNRGQKPGFEVVRRYREFQGSSGLGLRSLRAGDSGRFDATVLEVASLHDLEPALVKAVIRAESAFNPTATSVKGAMGLMQLMPDTARMHGVRNAYDPVQNIQGGSQHLRYLMDRYQGELDFVLAAYNAGTKPVDEAGGIPRYAETQEYVRRVRLFYAHYQTTLDTSASATRLAKPLKLEVDGRSADELYGRPIVLVGGAPMSMADPAPLTPAPRDRQIRPAL